MIEVGMIVGTACLGIKQTTTVIVGSLIGANKEAEARHYASMIMMQAFAYACIFSATLFVFQA